MRKISMILFAAVMTVAFVACSGNKSEEQAQDEQQVQTEEVAPAAEASSAEEVLVKYEKFVDQLIPLVEKMQKGDASVQQDYMNLVNEMQTLGADLQKYAADFTPEQTKRMEDAAKKYTDAIQAMTQK